MSIMELGNITLYNDDCFNVLPKLESNSIDMVFADLPYGTTANKWDSVLDLFMLWDNLHNIGKSNTPFLFTAQIPFSIVLGMSNLKELKYEWIWQKERGSNFLTSKIQPQKDHENILCFYNKQTKYFPQMRPGKPYVMKKGGPSTNYTAPDKKEIITVSNGERYPLTVLQFKRDASKVHPTQKPVELLEYLIKTYTNEEDTVLDPTMGSGTTALACARLNRKCIGIEKDRDYFDIAVNRVLGEII